MGTTRNGSYAHASGDAYIAFFCTPIIPPEKNFQSLNPKAPKTIGVFTDVPKWGCLCIEGRGHHVMFALSVNH